MFLYSLAVFFLHIFTNTHASLVDFLNEATFERSITRSPHFVLFYAPWCGHCKTLLSPWNELAKRSQVHDEKSRVKFAKVNCMEDTALCSEQNILAYPTMKLFNKGSVRRFDGRRSISGFEIFIEKVLNDEVDVEEVDGLVTLTTETFDAHTRTGLHFVEFYAPWCVHCKHFEPTWKAIAKHFEKNPDITICKIDCTAEMSKCQELRIPGFPTLKLFKDGAEVDHYLAERRMDTLITYINDNLLHHGLKNLEDNHKQEPEETNVDQNEENVIVTDDGDDTEKDEEEIDLVDLNPVVEIIDKTFDVLIEDPTFVMFYVPWCKFCQQFKPVWESLGKRCQNEGLPVIARINCSKFPEICERYKFVLSRMTVVVWLPPGTPLIYLRLDYVEVDRYPTLVMFIGGKTHVYKLDRDLETLYKFVRSFHDEL